MKIKKAVLPIGGIGTRFLPLSRVFPKELWPLVDIPLAQHLVREAKDSGVEEIIFVVSPNKKIVFEYFIKNSHNNQSAKKIEKLLSERKKTSALEELRKLDEFLKGLSFSFVFQRKPLGDGHAVLQAAKLVGQEPCAVLFGDDIVDSQTPCLNQLAGVFKTCQRPVISLCRLPKERLSSYGVVKAEKIANRLFKIKGVVEKPDSESAPSNLAIVGKYILTPEVFDYLKKTSPDKDGEIRLAAAFDKMIKSGKMVYGYEFEGKWLECGNKIDWLKSNFYLALKHPQYGPELRKFFKEVL